MAEPSKLRQGMSLLGMLDGFRSMSSIFTVIASKRSPNQMNQPYPVTQIIETTSTHHDLIKM